MRDVRSVCGSSFSGVAPLDPSSDILVCTPPEGAASDDAVFPSRFCEGGPADKGSQGQTCALRSALARSGLAHYSFRTAAVWHQGRGGFDPGHRHRPGSGYFKLDACRGYQAEPGGSGQGCSRRFYKGTFQRSYRDGGIRCQGIYSMPTDHRLRYHPRIFRAGGGWNDRGRHGHRDGASHGGEPAAEQRGQVESHHPADGRAEQPGRDRSGDGSAGCPGV